MWCATVVMLPARLRVILSLSPSLKRNGTYFLIDHNVEDTAEVLCKLELCTAEAELTLPYRLLGSPPWPPANHIYLN